MARHSLHVAPTRNRGVVFPVWKDTLDGAIGWEARGHSAIVWIYRSQNFSRLDRVSGSLHTQPDQWGSRPCRCPCQCDHTHHPASKDLAEFWRHEEHTEWYRNHPIFQVGRIWVRLWKAIIYGEHQTHSNDFKWTNL